MLHTSTMVAPTQYNILVLIILFKRNLRILNFSKCANHKSYSEGTSELGKVKCANSSSFNDLINLYERGRNVGGNFWSMILTEIFWWKISWIMKDNYSAQLWESCNDVYLPPSNRSSLLDQTLNWEIKRRDRERGLRNMLIVWVDVNVKATFVGI